MTGESAVLQGPSPVRLAREPFLLHLWWAPLWAGWAECGSILYSGCVMKSALNGWPWKQSPNKSPGTRSTDSEFSALLPAGLTIMFFFNFGSITYKKILWIWKIRYLKPTISGGYFCVWRIDFYFFPSLSPVEQKAMWIPFVYFFVSAPDCLITLADMCVALL